MMPPYYITEILCHRHCTNWDFDNEDEYFYAKVDIEAAREIDRTYTAIQKYVDAIEELNYKKQNPEQTTEEELEDLEYEVDRHYEILTYYAADLKYGNWTLAPETKQILRNRQENKEDIINRVKRARSTKVKHRQLLDDIIIEIMDLRRQLQEYEEGGKERKYWHHGML